MKVIRKRYLDELIARKHNGLVKILTGIRRCGKSFLLSVLFKEHLVAQGVRSDHIIEVPLDEDAFVGMRDAISLGAYIKSHLVLDGDWNYVFVDEVQLAKKVLPEVVDPNRFAPEDRDDLYVTFQVLCGGSRTPQCATWIPRRRAEPHDGKRHLQRIASPRLSC